MCPWVSAFKVNSHEIVFWYGTEVLAVTCIFTESFLSMTPIGVTNIPTLLVCVDTGIVPVAVVGAPSSLEFIP